MASVTVRRVQAALRAQDPAHALDLIGEARASSLSRDDRQSLRFSEAAALRTVGRLPAARDIYTRLLAEVGSDAPLRAEALHGLAECYLGVGDAGSAEQLAEASLPLSGERTLHMRCLATYARAVGRRDLEGALRVVRGGLAGVTPPGSARAHLRLCEAELLLAIGDLERARRSLGIARADGAANDASRTVADVLRLEAVLAVLAGDAGAYPKALAGLVHAERLYDGLGDRSHDLVLTARAEIFKHRGQLARAARDFRRGAWEAHQRRDMLQVGHNLLGLADTLRLGGGSEDPRPLRRAEEIYRRFDLSWGLLHAALVGRATVIARGDEDAAVAFARQVEDLLRSRAASLGEGAMGALSAAPPRPLTLSFPR